MDSVLLVLLFAIAIAVTAVAAKRGAERAQAERAASRAHAPALRGRAGWPSAEGEMAPPEVEPSIGEPLGTRGVQATSAGDPATVLRRRASPAMAVAGIAPRAGGGAVYQTRVAPRPDVPPVNLNDAGPEELRTLPGIGVKAAERIVGHRELHGPFASVEDLRLVEGFDAHRVARLGGRATV